MVTTTTATATMKTTMVPEAMAEALDVEAGGAGNLTFLFCLTSPFLKTSRGSQILVFVFSQP